MFAVGMVFLNFINVVYGSVSDLAAWEALRSSLTVRSMHRLLIQSTSLQVPY